MNAKSVITCDRPVDLDGPCPIAINTCGNCWHNGYDMCGLSIGAYYLAIVHSKKRKIGHMRIIHGEDYAPEITVFSLSAYI